MNHEEKLIQYGYRKHKASKYWKISTHYLKQQFQKLLAPLPLILIDTSPEKNNSTNLLSNTAGDIWRQHASSPIRICQTLLYSYILHHSVQLINVKKMNPKTEMTTIKKVTD